MISSEFARISSRSDFITFPLRAKLIDNLALFCYNNFKKGGGVDNEDEFG